MHSACESHVLPLLLNMFTVKLDRILFHYGKWQEFYRSLKGPIEFHRGMPQLEDYSGENEKTKLITFYDLMRGSSAAVALDLFSHGSHHKNLSVIFMTQNHFYKEKAQRDISFDTTFVVIFKNPRNCAQIS